MSGSASADAPTPPPPPPSLAEAKGPRALILIRRARYRDIPALVRQYMNRTEESRHGYHPFAFNRASLVVVYFSLITVQYAFGWLMRRWPRTVAILLVAQLGDGRIAGSGTLRGVIQASEEPRVRFGFVVGEGFQGMGIGKRLLWALAEAGLAHGYRWGIGVVFRSDQKAISAISKAGFRFQPTDYRDPRAPDEPNYATEADLADMVRRAREYGTPY